METTLRWLGIKTKKEIAIADLDRRISAWLKVEDRGWAKISHPTQTSLVDELMEIRKRLVNLM